MNSILALGEVDKTQVVKYSPYVKHYRAYLTRTHLKPIRNGKKYLYFYNRKEKDFSILVYRSNQYVLYSLYHPKKRAIIFNTNRKTRYRHIVRKLKHLGYYHTSCTQIACISHVSLRKYKGIKTLHIEVKDYRRLQDMYKKAIRTYNAKSIRSIRVKLPKQLISAYFNRYEKRAKTQKQLEQLQIIATKLQLPSAKSIAKKINKDKDTVKTGNKDKIKKKAKNTKKKITEEPKKEEVKVIDVVMEKPQKPAKSYYYYLRYASYDELHSYLSSGDARNDLTYNQYNTLQKRRTTLREEKLLRDGSLEELIEAYKKNKDPRYKARILMLMKKAQENK
ncbi:hypothetical protein [Sulfurovum sp.]|uniref:hypothetical protein n=1 Tax=Sulfurovum sp. TaxID=1969726 RepID=UPI0025E1618B|nr:hypothetical protein [Sulfurovum sp.]